MKTNNIQAALASDKERQAMLKVEFELLTLAGIQSEHISVSDMFINDSEYIHYIQISKVPPIVNEKQNNVLLFIHGYGGFGAVYYKVLADLADDFHCIAIDAPGMGFSSRVSPSPFECIDTCVEFFVSRIKGFADGMGLEKFNLVGHSLGAYISAHFFHYHHERVEKLILLSPAGMNMAVPDQETKLMKFIEEKNFFVRYLAKKFVKRIFKEKSSPFTLMFWPFKKFFFQKYLSAKRFKFTDRERDLLAKLMVYFASLPECGERSIGYLLHYGQVSQKPIIDILSQKPDRADSVMIMYGEFDFMDKHDTIQNLNTKNLDIKITYAKDCDHQLPFQNSLAVKEHILAVFSTPKEFTESEIAEVKIDVK